jgi:hypothetical protein
LIIPGRFTAATTGYDITGRPLTLADGKGSKTYSYDNAGEHRGLLTQIADSQAGTFTASYDPDGNPTTTGYPGGLQAERTLRRHQLGSGTVLPQGRRGLAGLPAVRIRPGPGPPR